MKRHTGKDAFGADEESGASVPFLPMMTSTGSAPAKPLPRRLVSVPCVLVLAAVVLVAALVRYLVFSAGAGIGGEGFGNILVQCVFRSYASIDHFQKSGKVWTSATSILLSAKDASLGMLGTEFPTDKMERHNYTAYYDLLLQPYLTRDVNVLEIGVKKGGSLKLWRELFSPDSFIYGIDIDQGVSSFLRDAHVKVLAMDSTDAALVTAALGGLQFDIIVDDGDHSPRWQAWTFNILAQFLKPTGVYIVEDAYDFRPELFNNVRGPYTYSRHADPSGESVIVFYPPASLASPPALGVQLLGKVQ